MICPVCGKNNWLPSGYIQYRCSGCGVWSHVDNWTYPDTVSEKVKKVGKKLRPMLNRVKKIVSACL